MAVTKAHTLYGVVAGATVIGGITQQNVNLGTQVRGEASSGEVYARFQSVVAQKPAATFTTLNVAAALAVSGLTAKAISALSPATLLLWAQKIAEGGSRAGVTSHRSYTINDGILFPTTLTVGHQGDAVLPYGVAVTWDGTNNPVVLSESQTLTAGITDAERFTLGPVTIESIALSEVRELQIDFGLQVVTEGGDSDIWDTMAYIKAVQPAITLRGIDIEWFKDSGGVPLAGLPITHANTSIYLKKRAAGGTFVADATAEHVKFTANGLAHVANAFDANGDALAECDLVIPLKYDGTLVPLVVNTASAIT